MVLILIKQILVMLIMMSVGVVLYKMKQIDEKGVAQLSNLALYVATPCVVVQALAIDFELPWGIKGSVEGIYNYDLNSVYAKRLGYTQDSFIIPFEVVSVLLLMTLICAITIARKTKDEVEKEKEVKQ